MVFEPQFIAKVFNKIMLLDNAHPVGLWFYNKRRDFITFLEAQPLENFDLYEFQRILLRPENETHLCVVVYLLSEAVFMLDNTQMFFTILDFAENEEPEVVSDVYIIRNLDFENHFYEQVKAKLIANMFVTGDED